MLSLSLHRASLFSTGNNSSYRCIARSLFPIVGRLSFPLLATLAYRCIARCHSPPAARLSFPWQTIPATCPLPALSHISHFHCYLLWLQVHYLLSRTSCFFIAIYSGYRCTARSLFLSIARLSFPLQTTPATCALPTLFLAIAHLACPLLTTGALSRRGRDGPLDRAERGSSAAPWSGSPARVRPRSGLGRGR